jgi:hypothetical protein
MFDPGDANHRAKESYATTYKQQHDAFDERFQKLRAAAYSYLLYCRVRKFFGSQCGWKGYFSSIVLFI